MPAYLYTPPAAENPVKIPQIGSSWHIQYTGDIDFNIDVDIYNIDLFDTDPSAIERLKERGVFVMCYFNAGAREDWRPDVDGFPEFVLGNNMEGWPGEQWLDIRRIEALSPIMEARLDLAVEKGCDGVDPDNINGYMNETGFPLEYEDQISFNKYLSTEAHVRGLSIGLKNDLEQIPDLLPFFDWALNEECFYYNECHLLQPFIDAGKPVFVIEYELSPEEFCAQANEMKFNAIRKDWELSAFSSPC